MREIYDLQCIVDGTFVELVDEKGCEVREIACLIDPIKSFLDKCIWMFIEKFLNIGRSLKLIPHCGVI